jgi:hypothetical protein
MYLVRTYWLIILLLLVLEHGVYVAGSAPSFTPDDPYFAANENFAGQ